MVAICWVSWVIWIRHYFRINFYGRCTGWWLTYPSEKYEFVSWDYDIPNIWKKKMFETTNQHWVVLSMYMYKSCIYLCTSTYKKTLLICTSLRLEFCPARWFSSNSCVARSLCETTIKTQRGPVWRKVSWSIKVDRTCWPRRILKKQIPSGWWLSHPSEKYESQLGWLFPINIWKHKKCSKPPTSHLVKTYLGPHLCLSPSLT